MLNHTTHNHFPVLNIAGSELHQLARCVDCRKPLFSQQNWKERLKSQLRRRFPWLSKKRHELPFGKYVVKQRCTECRRPLRCSECSEEFFSNLSPEEIRVFIKAIVLYVMKAQCLDCNDAFRLVYKELFEDESCASPAATDSDGNPPQSYSRRDVDEGPVDPKVESEIVNENVLLRTREPLNSTDQKRMRVRFAASNDRKQETNDHLGNTLQELFER